MCIRDRGLQAEQTGVHGVPEAVLQAVERPPGMLGGARRPRLVEAVGWPPGRYLPARRNSCAGIVGVEVGGGARRAGIEKGIVALLVGVDMRTLGAAMGFAARARGHEDAGKGNSVELEVDSATLSDPVVVPWRILRSSVSELGELGPSLEHPLCDGSARTCAAFEHVLCGGSAHICAAFEHVLGGGSARICAAPEHVLRGGSARICAAFEHVLLKRANYRDQASQNPAPACAARPLLKPPEIFWFFFPFWIGIGRCTWLLPKNYSESTKNYVKKFVKKIS